MAELEGAKGVKWSKMTDPSGIESPSGVGPVLVWQQPHPIYLAELVYRARKAQDERAHKDQSAHATLLRYKNIVFATADYMATFVDYDPARKEYVLGPGLNSADEKHTDLAHNLNPTMELAYWKWALETAQQWRVRLGLAPDPKWQRRHRPHRPAHRAQRHLPRHGTSRRNHPLRHDDLHVRRPSRPRHRQGGHAQHAAPRRPH